ncbi:Mitochondrial import inner membrane translocase subunit tim8 [Ascochyta clinopodiicola]|nr:Mitochondrial import inner membrane translocase subunit tim8 [Ascochyta clinopodiicola]
MRPPTVITLIVLVVFTAGRAIHGPSRSVTVTSLLPTLQLRDLQINKTDFTTSIAADHGSDPENTWSPDPDDDEDDPSATLTPEQEEVIWCKAKSRGVKLIKAMTMNDGEAQTMLGWPYMQSPWDGDLKPELRKWGYLDDDEKHEEVDDQCDFDRTHEMGDAFKDLQVDPRSAGNGGPNHCFYVEHMNGPTVIRDEDGELPFEEDQHYNVDGKDYQVTQAYAKIGVNPTNGLVYFIHRESPESAAEEHWKRKPAANELPALRSSSDIAWGIASSNLRNLNYFMAVQVINPQTQYVMKRALQQYNVAVVPAWPGKDFEFSVLEGRELELEAALALLGSSNGLGAGYFIIQHRPQLGWKYIWKVKIFMAGQGEWALPNVLFYVSDHATFEGQESQHRLDEQLKDLHFTQRRKREMHDTIKPEVVYKSKDGKNVIPGRVVPASPRPYSVTKITTLVKVFGAPLATDNTLDHSANSVAVPLPSPIKPAVVARAPLAQLDWQKYVCRGEKLNQACKLDKGKATQFAGPIDSVWDGTMEAELKLWGYKELPADSHCYFGDIEPAFRALKIDMETAMEGGSNYCFQVCHFDAKARNAQGERIAYRDQTYKVNDKEYRVGGRQIVTQTSSSRSDYLQMTGAYSIIGVNVRSGVVYFVDVRSASNSAEYLWKPEVPTADKLPALKQISDISWGFWNRVHPRGRNLGKINMFLVHNIVNSETNRLIEQSLKLYPVLEGQQRVTELPKWPGLTFDIETEAGQAMLGRSGSPNGIAVGYFLSQHKPQLGSNKYVHQASIFSSEWEHFQPSIIFHVKDAPPPTKAKLSKRTKGLAGRDLATAADILPFPSYNAEPAFGGDSPPPAKRPKLNPGSPENPSDWAGYVCRGDKLTRASKLNADKGEAFVSPINSPWTGALKAERKLWGYTDMPYADCDFEGEYYDVRRAYKALKVLPESEDESETEDSNDCFCIFHYDPQKTDDQGRDIEIQDQTYKVNDKVYRATGAHATFGVNVHEGILWFIDRASAPLKAASLWGVEKPPVDQLPALRQMSDLAWGFWHEAHGGSNLGHITKFIIPQIINQDTIGVIERVLATYIVPDGQQRLTAVPIWPGVTFDVETDQGKALLGSLNGIAAAYFLSQHKPQIGAKYVHQINVFQPDENEADSDEPTLIFYVKDAPYPSPEDEQGLQGSEEKKTLARRDDQSFWQQNVCRGEKLTQASLRNKDTAIQFANPIDSEWDGTMETELKLWGYTDFRGKSMYCELDNIADSLNQIGIDAKFMHNSKNGQNQCFNIGHRQQGYATPLKDQRYTVGDKEYRMTNAYAHIGVNARDGVISFLNVKSAVQSASQNWAVEKLSLDELPKLRQLSDISWAFWRRAHPDGANLDNINKFLVHDIVNDDTLRLIGLALKTYRVPEGQQRYNFLPKWPGLTFSIETEEGKAMLGSPNGIAAGYFVAQHKTQLQANKYVYQVTVWKDQYGDEQMMFWVKNAPPPANNSDRSKTPVPQNGDVNTRGKVVKRSADGRNIVREHIVLAKL